MIEIVKVVVILPHRLLAETVYITGVSCNTDGVPLKTPVAGLRESPVGKEGTMIYCCGEPLEYSG